MPLILFVPRVPVAWAIALFSVAYFGQQSWSTLVMVLPADIFPRQAVGAVAGLVGFGGAMGGVVFGQAVGYLLDHGFGYGLVFALAGSFHVVAFAVICLAIPRIEPLALAPRRRFMKIKEIRTRVVEWRGKTVAAAPALLHQPHGPARAARSLDAHLHLPRLARGGSR